MAEGEVSQGPGPQVQYQDIAANPYPPFAGVSGATATQPTQVLPGQTFQYQDWAEPLAVPTIAPPTVPDGVAAWAAQVPSYVLRQRMLNEMGVHVWPVLTPEVSGSALSWVPVYRGKLGYPFYQQQDHTDPSLWVVPNTSGAPTGVAAWAAQYPDRVGRPASQYPNVGPDVTWTPIPIAPLGAVVRQQHLDLRRRQLLLVRRLVR